MPFLVGADVDSRFATAVSAEFLGTLLFQFLGGVGGSSIANGLSYAVLVYATQHVSGGHLNPCVTLATMFSGHVHPAKGALYIVAQIIGAVAGAALEALLVPGLHLGRNSAPVPGCFVPNVTNWELFFWELVLTFVLIYVIYAVAIASPGHGNMGPLAAGLTVLVAWEVGSQYGAAAVNPARLLGPALVFFCTWRSFWIYLLGEVVGAILAAAVAVSQYGTGGNYESGFRGYSFAEARAAEMRQEPLLGSDRGGAVNV